MSDRDRPYPLRTDGSDAFAHDTMIRRIPEIIRETQRLNPDYPAEIHAALDDLRLNIQSDAPIPHINDPVWGALLARHAGETWLNSEWFFSEIYFYRLLIEAVRWEQSGRDPFAPKKIAEIRSEELRETLEAALELPASEEGLYELLLHAVMGNRVDLSYAVSVAHGSKGDADDLLVDDRAAVVETLLRSPPGDIHMILDNAGTELALDLALVNALLDGAAERVVLHVKRHPTFVSDATEDDVLTFLAEMTGRGTLTKGFGDAGKEVGARLHSALLDGRLLVEADIFWNTAWFLWDMPPRFEYLFTNAALVISKGDANYRRIVGDALWQPETPFSAVTRYFPAPLLALRTLKSPPIVGLPAGLAARLDTEDAAWRINGRRGVAQFST